MTNKDKIREFIQQRTQSDVQDSTDIFETRLVDSMFVMELVLFVEQEFGILIGGDDLNFDYFRSIDALGDLVGNKLASC